MQVFYNIFDKKMQNIFICIEYQLVINYKITINLQNILKMTILAVWI